MQLQRHEHVPLPWSTLDDCKQPQQPQSQATSYAHVYSNSFFRLTRYRADSLFFRR